MIRILFIFGLVIFLNACMPIGSSDEQAVGVATGMLKTRNYIVTLYASQGNPLYSVRSLDGTLLQEEISLETMVALFPELDYLKDNDNISWAGLDGITPSRDALGIDR
jgi:hypothetical protein